MVLLRPLIALVLALALLPVTGAPVAGQETGDAVAQARASVVTVYTYRPAGPLAADAGRTPSGSGSGWVYAEGIVVTNAHVVAGADDITVLTTELELISASVVGSDWYQDLAVLALDADDPDLLPPVLPVAGDPAVEVGTPVTAIGTPHGRYTDTASSGEVLGVGEWLDTGQGYSLLNLIRHSARLSPGNSGGPLVDADGAVVGVNVASRRGPDGQPLDSPISFAIAIEAARPLIEEMLETGGVARPWLGVTTAVEEGETVVQAVESGSPADDAGLQEGDVIIAVAGEAVGGAAPFIDLLYRHAPGDTVALKIERDGEALTVEVTLDARSE